jgi:hypothetical protein
MPSLNKTVHSHNYFKPEGVCTISVVEMGLDNTAVEHVVAHLWKMKLQRKGKMTQCRSRHSQRKPSRWRPRKSF